MLRRMVWLWMGVVATACGVLGGVNEQATMQAENAGYMLEATAIVLTAEAEAVMVLATAQAAETTVANTSSINLQLLATVRAGSTPTLSVRSEDSVAAVRDALREGQRYFVKTGVSSSVRNSDGCVTQAMTVFPENVGQIYATALVFNIQAGTPLAAEWYYEDRLVWTDRWTNPNGSAEMCFWFNVTNAEVDFRPGNWSVALFADGFQLEERMLFSIQEGAMMSDG